MEDSKKNDEETKDCINLKSNKQVTLENWTEYDEFLKAHDMQIYGINFPVSTLGEKLYYKLKHEVFDSSIFFEIVENQEEGRFALNSKQAIKKDYEVFLVDHCWTFKLRQFNYFCEKFPNVIERVYKMLKYSHIKRDVNAEVEEQNVISSYPENYLDCDHQIISNLENLSLPEKIEAVSLENNKISDFNSILEFLTSKGSKLKAIWLEGNNFEEQTEGYENILQEMFESLQLINRKFTKNASSWALKFIQNKSSKSYSQYDKLYGKNDYLDLSGRDPLKIKDLTIFSHMSNIKALDIKDNHYEYDYENKEFFNKLLQLLYNFPQLETLMLMKLNFLRKNPFTL